MSRKKRHRTDALFALRSAIQKTMAATRFARVPPAATSRESKLLDHATVVSTPDGVPVSRAVAAWPSPSCTKLASIAATRLIAQTVSASSLACTGAVLIVSATGGSCFMVDARDIGDRNFPASGGFKIDMLKACRGMLRQSSR